MTTFPTVFHGYLTLLKTMNVEALKAVFDDTYPTEQFRGVHVSIEYPIDEMSYPGIWVDYSDMDKLRIAGVDHHEMLANPDGTFTPYTRWKYSGYVSYTVTALTSLERDRLYDELVRVFAFRDTTFHQTFRDHIETNPFVAANMDFDEIEPQGNSATPGTPWGTDEIIYERTINMEIIGEFITATVDGAGVLFPLSAVLIEPTAEPGPPGALTDADSGTGWH